MGLSEWFWIIYVIGILFAGWNGWRDRYTIPMSLWLLVLLFILGLAAFHSPIK